MLSQAPINVRLKALKTLLKALGSARAGDGRSRGELAVPNYSQRAIIFID